MARNGEESTEMDDIDVEGAINQSDRIDDDRTEFERWEDTDSSKCRHKYADRKVEYLKQWDKFTIQTTASTLSVCRKCGFFPGNPRY